MIKKIVLDFRFSMMSWLVVLRLTLARLLWFLLVGRFHCKRGLVDLIGVRVGKRVVILVGLGLQLRCAVMELWTITFSMQLKCRGLKHRRAFIFLISILAVASRNSLVTSVGIDFFLSRGFLACFSERMLRSLRSHGHSSDW